MEVNQQHLFAFEHAFGEGSGFIDFALFVGGMLFIKIVSGVDVEFVFHGANEGLILAEIELSSEDEPFEKPAWLGKEVSGDRRYYNSMLTKHPFNSSNT